MKETIKKYFPNSEPEIFSKGNTVIRLQIDIFVVWFDIYGDSCIGTVSFGNYKHHTTMFSTPNEQGISLDECCKMTTDFMLDLSKSIFDNVLNQNTNSWLLSQKDSEIIVSAMDNPPPPSPALVDIFKEFKHTHNPNAQCDEDWVYDGDA